MKLYYSVYTVESCINGVHNSETIHITNYQDHEKFEKAIRVLDHFFPLKNKAPVYFMERSLLYEKIIESICPGRPMRISIGLEFIVIREGT